MPRVAAVALREPGFLLRFVAIVGVVDGALLAVLAFSPNLAVAIGVHAILACSVGTLAPAFFALISLVAPARVRSASFSTISIFAIPGIAVVLPLLGSLSDRYGVQASIVAFVPVAALAGLILASAGRFVNDDIAAAMAPAEPPAAEAGPVPDPASVDAALTADPPVATTVDPAPPPVGDLVEGA